jgi:uncharacterized protein YjbI with pentapeptide repeats
MRFIDKRFQNADIADVLGFLIGISVAALIISAIANFLSTDVNWADWVEGISQNFATEIIGAIATYALFDLIIGRRNEQRRLINEMRSSDVATAMTALEQIRSNGGLFDGSLNSTDLRGLQLPASDMKNAQFQGSNLDNANLSKADLSKAVLEGVSLHDADLSGANFWLANLQGADLQDANLSEADLRLADVQGAILRRARLENARLFQTKLESSDLANANLQNAFLAGANLLGANLTAANLKGARMDGNTILPDGKNWTEQTDMRRFTSPDYHSFWKTNNDNEGLTSTSIRIDK